MPAHQQPGTWRRAADPKTLAAAVMVAAAFALVYWRVLTRLVYDWRIDENYSHGFLIIPIAAFFVWERRGQLLRTPIRPNWFGLVVMAGGILVLLAGLLGAELFLSRVSIIGTLAGIVLFMLGWQHLRILAFPLAFLLLMIPIPAIIFNEIAFPLQLFASRLGEYAIASANIPVLREGNVLVLANVSLEVAEACSGIRSLVSLLTLGIVYGYFVDSRFIVRLVLALSTVPIAILANGIRVAGTGIAARYYGPEAAEGLLHEFSGWVMFVFAFIAMLAIQRLIELLTPSGASATARVEQPA